MLTNSGPSSSRAVVKPVPKPRTVFNRRRTAPIHFCPTPDAAAPPFRRLSQESICFPVLEALTSGDPPDNRCTTSQRASRAHRMRPSRSLSLSDTRGLLPLVPPRQNHRFTGCQPLSSSPICTDQNQTVCPDSSERSKLSGSSPTGDGGIEMVSNEIYWGTSLRPTDPVGRIQQHVPPPPPRQSEERNRYCRPLVLISLDLVINVGLDKCYCSSSVKLTQLCLKLSGTWVVSIKVVTFPVPASQ